MNGLSIVQLTNHCTEPIDLSVVRDALLKIFCTKSHIKNNRSIAELKTLTVVDSIMNMKNLEGFAELGGNKIFVTPNFELPQKHREDFTAYFAFLLTHEICHSYGLSHCKSKKCVMSLRTKGRKKVYGWKILDPRTKRIFCEACNTEKKEILYRHEMKIIIEEQQMGKGACVANSSFAP